MAGIRQSRASRPACLAGWRRLLAYATVLVFAFQTYVVQTHIHFAPSDHFSHSLGAELEKPAGALGPSHGKPAGNDDPANCPICQEFLLNGQFVAPSAAIFVAPSATVSTVTLVDIALPFIFAPSHDWRGRAPPLS